MNTPSLFLRKSRPSFLEGLAELFEPASVMKKYHTSPTAEIADGRGIAADFLVVGDDLRAALTDYAGRR